MCEKQEMKDYKALGLDVLMTKTFWELCRDIPKRIVALVSKLLSFKTVLLVATGWLMSRGVLESWAFLAVVVLVLFERAGLKALKDIKK